MSEILGKIPDFIEAFALLGMLVSIMATVLVRLTPTKSDDEKVAKVVGKIQKALSYLPTLGINPRTQLLEQQLKEMQEKLKAKENG